MKGFIKSFFFSSCQEKNSKKLEKSASVHWIVEGELAVGPLPKKENVSSIVSYGFKSVLTVCSEEEGSPPSELIDRVEWRRVPLVDSHCDTLMTGNSLTQAIQETQELIRTAKPLYVHCVAGMERSPSVCVAYLCKVKGMPLWEALNWVKQANPRTNIIDSQLSAIQATFH